MTSYQTQTKLSPDELLDAVKRLNASDLELFTSQVLAIRARRKSSSLTTTESELMLLINQGLSPSAQKRYDDLIALRRDETLTPQEYTDLLDLTQLSEKIQVSRVEALVALSRIRGISLNDVMNQLGVKLLDYA